MNFFLGGGLGGCSIKFSKTCLAIFRVILLLFTDKKIWFCLFFVKVRGHPRDPPLGATIVP